jgi:hypothetical protein
MPPFYKPSFNAFQPQAFSMIVDELSIQNLSQNSLNPSNIKLSHITFYKLRYVNYRNPVFPLQTLVNLEHQKFSWLRRVTNMWTEVRTFRAFR